MKILVLGGNGFIGSHVVEALAKNGHEVRVLSRTQGGGPPSERTFEHVLGDYRDPLCLGRALEGVDLVFHCISSTVPATSNVAPVEDIESNLVATVRLIELMLARGVDRIVFISSGGTVYGRTSVGVIPESHPLRPVCSYGIVKVAIEQYLEMFQARGLRPTILRPSNPYGERQGNVGLQGVVGTFLAKALKGEPVTIWGDGSVVRDYVYVCDLARACLIAAEAGVCGVFNIGSGEGRSVKEVLGCVQTVTGSELQVDYRDARSFDVARAVLDISKAQSSLGWRPTVSFEQGVENHWQWLREASKNG